jgi:two-component system, chemotaxis family, protein-glutamate methylesterase/glutaminase
MTAAPAIRVLVVDDSAFMRLAITRALNEQAAIEVVGTAHDGIEALAKARMLRPDVITLDIEMPNMDGLQTLAALMRERPVPVVMLSSLTTSGAPATIKALELGAVDFVAKPAADVAGPQLLREDLVRAVGGAVHARLRPAGRAVTAARSPAARVAVPLGASRAERVLAIGCSTGGPRALMDVLPRLPGNLPAAVLVVQHMPAGFTRSLAERLNEASALDVREAEDGDLAVQGRVLLAPGGQHMRLDQTGRVRLDDGPTVHGVRPAVDLLFASLPPVFGAQCVAAVLTGMGSDGADGAAAIRAAGGRVLAEDASTCVVYGMPRAIVERGIAERHVPLPAMAGALTDMVLSSVAPSRRAAS